MIGAIVVTLIVYVIVGSYMAIVNRMLRTDEHWHESDMVQPVAEAAAAPRYDVAASAVHA
jgi:hypothetical protein